MIERFTRETLNRNIESLIENPSYTFNVVIGDKPVVNIQHYIGAIWLVPLKGASKFKTENRLFSNLKEELQLNRDYFARKMRMKSTGLLKRFHETIVTYGHTNHLNVRITSASPAKNKNFRMKLEFVLPVNFNIYHEGRLVARMVDEDEPLEFTSPDFQVHGVRSEEFRPKEPLAFSQIRQLIKSVPRKSLSLRHQNGQWIGDLAVDDTFTPWRGSTRIPGELWVTRHQLGR